MTTNTNHDIEIELREWEGGDKEGNHGSGKEDKERVLQNQHTNRKDGKCGGRRVEGNEWSGLALHLGDLRNM